MARRVAGQKPVARQLALDRLDRPDQAVIVRRQEAGQRDRERGGVQLGGAVVLGERVAVRVEAALADLCVDLVANLTPPLERRLDRGRDVQARRRRALDAERLDTGSKIDGPADPAVLA